MCYGVMQKIQFLSRASYFVFLKDKEYLYAKECIYVYASKLFIK